MRRRSWAAVLAVAALGAGGCGGGGDSGDEAAVVLFEESFDGAFPGTAWATLGDVGTDDSLGSPAPCLRLGSAAGSGSCRAEDDFPTAGGLTFTLQVRFSGRGSVMLVRPDSSVFVEVTVLPAPPPGNLFVNAAGAAALSDLALDGTFRAVEVRLDPDASAVTVLLDGVVIAENATPGNPPPTVSPVASGEAPLRIDEVRITTP